MLYFDGNNNDVKRAVNNGSWAAETIAGEGTALGFHNEVVSVDGQTFAACYDYTNRTIWFSTLE